MSGTNFHDCLRFPIGFIHGNFEWKCFCRVLYAAYNKPLMSICPVYAISRYNVIFTINRSRLWRIFYSPGRCNLSDYTVYFRRVSLPGQYIFHIFFSCCLLDPGAVFFWFFLIGLLFWCGLCCFFFLRVSSVQLPEQVIVCLLCYIVHSVDRFFVCRGNDTIHLLLKFLKYCFFFFDAAKLLFAGAVLITGGFLIINALFKERILF